jgi:hypothetical protein
MKNVINFFAYGELMNKDIFSQHGLECLARTTVTLSAWKVVFNRIPKEKDSPEGLGLTNIEPTPDSDGMLYGVLYEMDDSFLPRLDEIHNYPEETLRKVFRFTRHDFNMVNGFAYVARPENTATGLKPSKAIKKTLKSCKPDLPMLYFSRMMNVRTID